MDKRLVFSLMVGFAVACGGGASDEYADSTPEASSLALEVTGAPAELSRAPDTSSDAVTQDLGTAPEYLEDVRAGVRALNTAVRAVLAPVKALSETTPTEQGGNTRVFGPQDQGNATFKLTVHKSGEKRFAWQLQAKAKGAADSTYQRVMSGRIFRSEAEKHHGRGVVGLDLDALATIDPTYTGHGKLFGAFSHQGEQRTLVYRALGFTNDPAAQAPITAAFYGHKAASGVTRVRLAALVDAIPGPAGAELLLSRAHFIPTVGGAAVVLIPNQDLKGAHNGDVADGKYLVGRTCWDAAEKEVFKLVLSCDAGKAPSSTTCTTVTSEGSRTACKQGVDADAAPSTDPGSTETEPDAPVGLDDDAPGEMPSF